MMIFNGGAFSDLARAPDPACVGGGSSELHPPIARTNAANVYPIQVFGKELGLAEVFMAFAALYSRPRSNGLS
jgi:hypothetical protein